jgi:hypothetical protein
LILLHQSGAKVMEVYANLDIRWSFGYDTFGKGNFRALLNSTEGIL